MSIGHFTPKQCFSPFSQAHMEPSPGEITSLTINPAMVNFKKKKKKKERKEKEIIPSIFSDHNAVRLDLNYRRKTIKNANIWRLNNKFQNNQQITEEIKKEIKICIEANENENTTTQNCGTL